MAMRNRIVPEKFTYDFQGKINTDNRFVAASSLKLLSDLKKISYLLRILGFFPYNYTSRKDITGKLHIEASTVWIQISAILFLLQVANLSFITSSYIIHDQAKWHGLVPTVWLITPALFFLQSTLYQAAVLLFRKKISTLYASLETLQSTVKVIPSFQMKMSRIISFSFVLMLPIAAYFSTCAIIKQADKLNNTLVSDGCIVWYSYLYASFSHGNYWYLIISLQFLTFFTSTVSSLLIEHWMLLCTKYITDAFRSHIDTLKYLVKYDEFVEPQVLSNWILDFSHAHSVTEGFIHFASPILLISVVTNPTIFCLQAFWIAQSSNYRMFRPWRSMLLPVLLLLSSFLRFANLGFAGQTFMDQVNGLSKTVSMISQVGFHPEIKFQLDLVMYKEASSPVVLTACSFLSFTRMLLTAVLGATATYLIILVQMSSDKPCS